MVDEEMQALLSKYLSVMPGRFVKTNGTELYVVDKGTGPAVLLLHGLGWTHALWRDCIEGLSARYRVIAGDSRGHGLSSKPSGPYSMDQMTEDWVGVLDALDVDRCSVVGLSQGGMIAMQLAIGQGDRISALSLLATSAHFSEELWAVMENRSKQAEALGPRASAEQTANAIFSDAFMSTHSAFVNEFIENRIRASRVGLDGAAAALKGFDARHALRSVKCPTLLMHGTDDKLIPSERAQEILGMLPLGACMAVSGGGHILPVECPDLILQELGRFLDANNSKDRRQPER